MTSAVSPPNKEKGVKQEETPLSVAFDHMCDVLARAYKSFRKEQGYEIEKESERR